MNGHVGAVKMLMGWEVLSSVFLLLLCGLWIKQWMYWWIRGVQTYGYPPPIGCLLSVWTGRLSIGGLTQDVLTKYPTCSMVGSWVLMKPILLIADPKLGHQVLAGDFSVWPDRGFKDDPDLDPLSLHLVNLSGKRWKLVRSWLSPEFGLVSLKSRYNNLVREAAVDITQSMSSEKIVNALTSTRKMTLSILTNAVLGQPQPSPAIQSLIKDAFKGSIWTTLRSAARMTCPGLLSSMGVKRFTTGHEMSFINLVQERYQMQRSEYCDMLQSLIDSYKQYKASADPSTDDINENILTSNAFGALAAGYDTTAVTLAWGLLELATHPKIQDKVYAEVHRVLAQHGEPNHAAIASMQYLDNVISEVLRKHPAVTVTSRVSATATTIGGLEVPAGLRVIVPIYSMHHDPAYFANPETFDPDRFARQDFPRIAYFPYGKGPRICIGWRFATMLMKVFIITLIKDFEIRLSSETKEPMGLKPNTLFLEPKHPIILKLIPRN